MFIVPMLHITDFIDLLDFSELILSPYCYYIGLFGIDLRLLRRFEFAFMLHRDSA